MSRRSHHGRNGHGRNRPQKTDQGRRATPGAPPPAASTGHAPGAHAADRDHVTPDAGAARAPEQAVEPVRTPIIDRPSSDAAETRVPQSGTPVRDDGAPLPRAARPPDRVPAATRDRDLRVGQAVLDDTDMAVPTAKDRVIPGPTDTADTRPGNGAAPAPTPPRDRPACTSAQLRRFIKSRPWIPMHELRRRFAINGGEDDVVAVEIDGRLVFVGLPAPEGRLLGDLLRAGEVGYELSLDPGAPIVIGVYPMRPVPRA